MLDLTQHPHRRYNSLTREWVLVSPQRTDRPWQGQVEEETAESQPEYDPGCYLCPGNARAGGVRNPAYTSTFVFDNDFAALRPETPAGQLDQGGLIRAEAERGISRVVCFSPRHDLTLARMSVAEIVPVVETWVAQYQELGALPFISSVQIFENRGAMMGASNPHPHCQIWANQSLPNEAIKESASQTEYYGGHQSCLLCDYLALERKSEERLVCENEGFYALVPFWAVWPFEIMVISKEHLGGMDDLSGSERTALADILKRVTALYDKLFQVSFPYTMGFHQRPTDGEAHPEWHLHAHFYPPLLRSIYPGMAPVQAKVLPLPTMQLTINHSLL